MTTRKPKHRDDDIEKAAIVLADRLEAVLGQAKDWVERQRAIRARADEILRERQPQRRLTKKRGRRLTKKRGQ